MGVVLFILSLSWLLVLLVHRQRVESPAEQNTQSTLPAPIVSPLHGYSFYVDPTTDAAIQVKKYHAAGDFEKASLLSKISTQPEAIWLNGPDSLDVGANRDISKVDATSTAAAAQHTLPFYILYAIPKRDACAPYSHGGFASAPDYLKWVDQILLKLHTKAVFVVEPDAIGHVIAKDCLNEADINERLNTLAITTDKLSSNENVKAVYIDAGHSEWFPDVTALKEPLLRSGIQKARGVAVNTAFFERTETAVEWSQKLVAQFGGNKGVLIDTSRNGNGPPPTTITGEARWCNPRGRALGDRPTPDTGLVNIDAYYWGKTVGQSDGACFGGPPAGVFMPDYALELARNGQ